MYLKCNRRIKNSKEHRYWSVVESFRTIRGVMKRQLLYLGELKDSQKVAVVFAVRITEVAPASLFLSTSLPSRTSG